MKNTTKKTSGLKVKLLHGSNWIVTIAAVVAVVLLVNVLVGMITEKFQLKIDLTPNRVIGITDTTKQVLKELDKDVNIVIFEDKSLKLPYVDEIIDKYLAHSSHLSLVKVDVVADPGFIKKYDITANEIMSNSMIVECGDKYKLIQPYEIFPMDDEGNMGATINAEGVLTSAITYVTTDENTKIGVVEGHGEYEFLNSNLGYALKQQFIDYSYVNLYTQDIPKDINCLVISGPERDFTDSEIDKIDEYLAQGKSLQIMLSATAPVLPNLEGYIAEWGIKVNNDTIKETNPNFIYNSNDSLIWVEGDTHYITSGLSQIIVPYAKSIDYERDVNTAGLDITSVFTTSGQAISKDNATGKEVKGKYNLAMIVEDSNARSSIVVVGSSSMYSDAYLEYNSDFFVNTLSYQMGKKQVAIIKPKSLAPASLKMTASDVMLSSIVVVFLIPFGILVWGFIVWLRRRFL
ncbi:MAG: GldG family protein [Eubacteriales bacterium]|nr:GldG family protein [Eubacteriales bacterium]